MIKRLLTALSLLIGSVGISLASPFEAQYNAAQWLPIVILDATDESPETGVLAANLTFRYKEGMAGAWTALTIQAGDGSGAGQDCATDGSATPESGDFCEDENGIYRVYVPATVVDTKGPLQYKTTGTGYRQFLGLVSVQTHLAHVAMDRVPDSKPNCLSGICEANLEQIEDDNQSSLDLKDLVDNGYDPSTDRANAQVKGMDADVVNNTSTNLTENLNSNITQVGGTNIPSSFTSGFLRVHVDPGTSSGQLSLSTGRIGLNFGDIINQSASVNLANTTVGAVNNVTNSVTTTAYKTFTVASIDANVHDGYDTINLTETNVVTNDYQYVMPNRPIAVLCGGVWSLIIEVIDDTTDEIRVAPEFPPGTAPTNGTQCTIVP